MKDIVIAGYARSPFTPASRGALTEIRPDDLAAQVIKALVKRTGINAGDIEDLKLGCAFPEGEQGLNLARLVGFLANLPISVSGVTVNRFCGSSMETIHMAAGAIHMNAGEAFISAGVESMSRVPMMGYNPLPNPDLYAALPAAYMSMGDTAEVVAKRAQISRAQQEAFAVESQRKAAEAQEIGRFKDEIVAINGKISEVSEDGCLRPETTAAGLGDLKPAFDEGGTVTAGTASPLRWSRRSRASRARPAHSRRSPVRSSARTG